MPTLPITANYRRAGDDWAVTVRTAEKSVDAIAPGLIAARVQVDQLVDELAEGHADRAVVHLLDGDAFAFSVAYLHTRHGLPAPKTGQAEPSTAHDQAIEV
ncbi:hypothetical protein ACQPZF_06590 [Actinosynnema sp. CS-041913]|uniref:hypothetical protein n=1 Tax=Actinosynnema sp. CS-041913 TaxID=3239917 RepID=UPI003D8A5893